MNTINNLNLKYKYDKQKENKYNSKLIKKGSQKNVQLKKGKIPKLDKRNYHKALLYKCGPKKSQSMQDFSKVNNPNNIYNALGPFTNLFNGGGGFCKRIENNNIKNYACLYLNNDKNIQNNINNPYYVINYRNKNLLDSPEKSNKISNVISERIKNYNSKNKNIKNKQKSNSNREKPKKRKIDKININEVFKNIKYLKLNNENNSDNNNILKLKEEINKSNNYKINLSDINNNQEEKNYENKSNIYINESSSTRTIPNNNDTKKNYNRVLIKQSNEQFSMKNNQIKKFNKLIEVDNVLLNYYPSFNIKNKNDSNTKSSLTNYSISSNQIEYTIIKDSKPKISLEESKKENIKTGGVSNIKITQDKKNNNINIENNINNNINEEKNSNINSKTKDKGSNLPQLNIISFNNQNKSNSNNINKDNIKSNNNINNKKKINNYYINKSDINNLKFSNIKNSRNNNIKTSLSANNPNYNINMNIKNDLNENI